MLKYGQIFKIYESYLRAHPSFHLLEKLSVWDNIVLQKINGWEISQRAIEEHL